MVRSAFVTGCSSGLGKEVALSLLAHGYRVFAGVRSAQDADAIRTARGAVTPITMDLRDMEQIRAGASRIDQLCGANGLALLVNAAGYTFVSPFEFTEEQRARDLFEVLFYGPAVLTKALLPALKRNRGCQDASPKVMNIVSWAAIDANPFVGYYSAAKAALLRLSDAQHYEFKRIGISAISIIPGLMRTPFITVKSEVSIQRSLRQLTAEGLARYGSSLAHMAALGRGAQSSSLIPNPDVVARRLVQIAQTRRPRSRYLIGTDTRLVDFLNRTLPLCVLEAIKTKVFRLGDSYSLAGAVRS